MGIIYLLPETRKFYKANLHCHSTVSDGNWTVQRIKEEYQKRGYSIVAFTDHRKLVHHGGLSDESFIALSGYEIDLNDDGLGDGNFKYVKTYHMNLFDTNPKIDKEAPLPTCKYKDLPAINEYIAKANKLGYIVSYNHPDWSLQNYNDYAGLKGLFAMEIYNHGCENNDGYGYNPQAYDQMLRSGQKIYCLATDDNHNIYDIAHPFCDSFGGFTMIKTDDFSYDGIIAALKNGSFYVSTGPEIEKMYIRNGKLIVDCSPVREIKVTTGCRRMKSNIVNREDTITHLEYEISGDEAYVRVDCTDKYGRHANSRAYFIEDYIK